jgi:Fe-S-cluster containining protein
MSEDILSIYQRRLHYNPIDDGLVARQHQTVVDIANRSRTGETALEIAAGALALADQLVSRYESAQSLPKPIVCWPGCYFCCSNQVELFPPEALLLGHFVEHQFSPAEKEKLSARIVRNLELRAGKNRRELAPLRPDLLCPLLQEERCSAYPVRPLFCRAHHSLAVAQCQREFRAEKVSDYEFYSHRYEIILSVRAGLQSGCQAIGCQAGVLDLVRALQVYLAGAGAAARWIAGEAVFGNDHAESV